jgi:hypothetical protein
MAVADRSAFHLLLEHGCVGEDTSPVYPRVLQAPKLFQAGHNFVRIETGFVSIG